MFETYDPDQMNATALDKHSIMLYAIPREWTLDGFSSKIKNYVLSEQDKTFAQDPRNYPKNGPRVTG